jgi:two-component system, LytTR family, sensor kinase
MKGFGLQSYQLGRKWLLGFALALIYIPLRTYINIPNGEWHRVIDKFPLFCIEILISTVFYTSWIYLVDWFLQKKQALTKTGKNADFKLSNQLITLLPAILLAIAFNKILIHAWGAMDHLLTEMPRKFTPNPNWLVIRPIQRRANEALIILALIAAYYLCVNNQIQEQFQKLLVDSEKLEKENTTARFTALKNQISPHFLFNNLSVLSSLVESQPGKSSEFIQQLSLVYRYILEQAELHQIGLKEEIRFLETYTYLLKTRFKDKVHINIDLTRDSLEQYSIIPLTLQLLIENAVKHNRMSSKNPLSINISISGNMLVVSNPLQPRNLIEGTTGLGLKNIINRYKLLVDKQVVVEKSEAFFTVKIPLIL